MCKEGQIVTELKFEQALAELEGIVVQLENGKLPLENSIALFERGQQLAQRCNTLLDEAELRVIKIEEDTIDPSQLVNNHHDINL